MPDFIKSEKEISDGEGEHQYGQYINYIGKRSFPKACVNHFGFINELK